MNRLIFCEQKTLLLIPIPFKNQAVLTKKAFTFTKKTYEKPTRHYDQINA